MRKVVIPFLALAAVAGAVTVARAVPDAENNLVVVGKPKPDSGVGGPVKTEEKPKRTTQRCAQVTAGPVTADGGTGNLGLDPNAEALSCWSSNYACCRCPEGSTPAGAVTSCSPTGGMTPPGKRFNPGTDNNWLPPSATATPTPDAGASDAAVCLCGCETGTCQVSCCVQE